MWPIVATVIGGILSLLNGLGLFALARLSKRLDNQDAKIDDINKRFTVCKVDCSQKTVTKEDWVRSEALTRQKLDTVAETMAKINGKLEIVQQLPDIAGRIAREVANALKSGGE
jgi:hypothetical protein